MAIHRTTWRFSMDCFLIWVRTAPRLLLVALEYIRVTFECEVPGSKSQSFAGQDGSGGLSTGSHTASVQCAKHLPIPATQKSILPDRLICRLPPPPLPWDRSPVKVQHSSSNTYHCTFVTKPQ
jgi:hypothetical protein